MMRVVLSDTVSVKISLYIVKRTMKAEDENCVLLSNRTLFE